MKPFETYMDVDIYYDVEREKFTCNLDDWNTARQSLKAVRKAIEEHFEKNRTFIPFKALATEYYSSDANATEIYIVSIRKDDDFMVSRNEDHSERYRKDKREVERLFSDNEANRHIIQQRMEIANKIKELEEQSIALYHTLEKIDPALLKPQNA